MALGNEKGPYLFGENLCYADLSIAYLLNGVSYAFPKTFKGLSSDIPRLVAIRDAVSKNENIAKFKKSSRALPFSNGIFRHYPELEEE